MMKLSIKFEGKSLSAAHLFRIAKNARERLQGKAPTSGGQDDALISIIFSAASIEAFLNELPEMLSLFPELHKAEAPQILTYVRLADETETSKGSIQTKYVLAYSVLSGKSCIKGERPYQDFSLLIEARNTLMHMKPSDVSGEAKPEGAPAMQPSLRTMERFRALNLLSTPELTLPFSGVYSTGTSAALQIPFPLPWNYRIATPAAAHWACNTAVDVVNKVVPDGSHKPSLLELCKTFERLD